MKALVKYGDEFGGYRYQDMPEPVCGDNDIILEVKAAAICGADLKHYNVENGSDKFNSIRGHEFAGEIVEIGKNVKDWKISQRVVSDNTGHVCGVCPACEQGDFLLCSEKVNLGLGINGGFTKLVKIPGEILAIHKRAIWEIPDNVSYEEAAILDPVCNAYNAIAQESSFLPGENVVVFGTGPLGLFSIQIAKIMGAVKIVVVGMAEDRAVRFDVARKLGATDIIDGSVEDVVATAHKICGKDGIGLVVDCAGANIVLKQGIEILRNKGEFLRVGMGFKPLDFSLNDISMRGLRIIGHMGYDTVSWRNSINLLRSGMVDTKSLITHRLPLSEWRKGFDLMISKEAIKVIFSYDGD